MSIEQVLQEAEGVLPTRLLLARNVSKREIQRAVQDRRVSRLHRGVIALPDADGAYATAYRFNGRLTCASAAGHYGLWLLRRPNRLHLSCRHGRLPESVVTHRRHTNLERNHVPVDPLIEVLYQALRCLPAMEALVMAESAVAMALVHPDTLRARLSGNRNGRTCKILDLVEGGSDSLLEPLARVIFRRAGIYTQTQVNIPGVGIVDFLLEGYVIVEIDGLTHLEKRQFKKDRRRDNSSVVNGYLVLRCLYDDVVYSPEDMLIEDQAVLAGQLRVPARHRGWDARRL